MLTEGLILGLFAMSLDLEGRYRAADIRSATRRLDSRLCQWDFLLDKGNAFNLRGVAGPDCWGVVAIGVGWVCTGRPPAFSFSMLTLAVTRQTFVRGRSNGIRSPGASERLVVFSRNPGPFAVMETKAGFYY